MNVLGALAQKRRLLKDEETNRLIISESHFFNAKMALITGVTNGAPETQTTHAHGLPITPTENQILFLAQDKAGSIYCSASPDGTNIYVKCDIATVAFTAMIIYEV